MLVHFFHHRQSSYMLHLHQRNKYILVLWISPSCLAVALEIIGTIQHWGTVPRAFLWEFGDAVGNFIFVLDLNCTEISSLNSGSSLQT